jgi:two-component system response regulator FixJ
MQSDKVVHVIDDDEAMRKSLAFMLRAAKLEVQTYASATDFLEHIPQAKPGCIVTDVRMPGISGIDLLRRLRELKMTMPVIVITGHGDVPLAVQAMKEGAIDFLEKPFAEEAMLSAIDAAFNVQAAHADRQRAVAEIQERFASLSTREREVLEGLVAGQANKVIAYNLGISPRTVEIYRANVMTKMRASSLSELVRMTLIGGVLESAAAPTKSR